MVGAWVRGAVEIVSYVHVCDKQLKQAERSAFASRRIEKPMILQQISVHSAGRI